MKFRICNTLLSRGSWASAVNSTISQSSYVNVAAKSTIDIVTRELTVEVEAYFTMNYGEIKYRKNKGTIKKSINTPKFKFMEEVLGPFKPRNRSTKKKSF